MASLRPLAIPRATLALHSKQLRHRLQPTARHATTTTPPKPRVLEKPERFNPPSHPSRLRTKPRQYPGPPLSEHERQAQKTRKYPHMMPAEGTFMHWFLTSRAVHTWITLAVLTSLVLTIHLTNFHQTTIYTDLLPPKSLFLSHPFTYLSRYWEVYNLHVAHTSAEVAERRRQNVEDVRKRGEFRKAHGMGAEEGVLGGWTARSDAEMLGPGMREGGAGPQPQPQPVETTREVVGEMEDKIKGEGRGAVEGETYVDFEGNRQPVRKKWLGIW